MTPRKRSGRRSSRKAATDPAEECERLRAAVAQAKADYEAAVEDGDEAVTWRKYAVLRILSIRFRERFPSDPQNRRQHVWEWKE
jgi:hypothetical protein